MILPLYTAVYRCIPLYTVYTKFSPFHSPDPFLFPSAPPPKMINFIPATLTEIYKLISASESKQCPLDSIPTFLLKLCSNELGPIITNLVNFSLSEGISPLSFKQALVQPLLKKPSLSTDDLNNFCPISILIFISKILEKVVASRIQSHLSSNSLSSSFQSAYRIFYSTETILLKIHNDLILAMDCGEVTSIFSSYLLPSILSIIPSSLLVFKIGSVLMVCLLIGSHLISHFALSQSQSMISSLHTLLFPVVYPKVSYLAHSFLLSIQLLSARWSQKIPSNIICTLMTPSCTSLSLLQILLYLLKHLPPLSMTFSPGWTWTNCFSIHLKLNFFSLAQNNNVSNFLI